MPGVPPARAPEAKIDDVMDLLKISKRKAFRMVAEGKIPSYRVGYELRFDLEEVAEAIRATRRPGSHA